MVILFLKIGFKDRLGALTKNLSAHICLNVHLKTVKSYFDCEIISATCTKEDHHLNPMSFQL
jgi:hypothetical protein